MTDKARELLLQAWEELLDAYEGSNGERVAKEIRAYLAEPEPDPVYLFAGWLTCQPGIMEVGACCDASPMAQAIDQYFQEYPERMFETKLHPAPRPEFVRLSEEEIADVLNVDPMWFHLPDLNWNSGSLLEYARAIEDALEEKNK